MLEIKNPKNIELPLENCKICGNPTNPCDMVFITSCLKMCGKCYDAFYTSKQKPRTNFDRITESVESLARYIENYTMFWWKKCDQCETYDHCNECIKEWLQKEIEE